MDKVQVKIYLEENETNSRLEELKLKREVLLEIRNRALGAAANATPNHAANARGIFAYHEGVVTLRDLLRDDGWKKHRINGIETVKNEDLGIQIGFCNVDRACDHEYDPVPRSPKGAGAERACTDNQISLFDFASLPKYVQNPPQDSLLYYLLVDENGGMELSLFTIKNGKFSQFKERIFLSDGKDLLSPEITSNEDIKRSQIDFEPIVKRK